MGVVLWISSHTFLFIRFHLGIGGQKTCNYYEYRYYTKLQFSNIFFL